jgi:hypothetical protein
MILSGTNDPITPRNYADTVASTLSNSFVVSYPRGGHTPSVSSPCLSVAVAAFIANPAQRPDTSCVAAETRPFLVPGAITGQALRGIGVRATRALRAQQPSRLATQ